MGESPEAVVALFAGSDPAVQVIYDRILDSLRSIGSFQEEPKKTSIHLVRNTGFAGVHPRKRSLLLNLRLDQALDSPRVVKAEQVSKHRYHNEVKLEHPEQVDDELSSWLRAAYELGA